MLVYLVAFPYHPALRSPNELSRLLQSRAIVDFGELELNRALVVYGPVGDLSIYRGRYYPSKAPLMSLAAAPVYAGLRIFSRGKTEAVTELAQVYFSRLFLTVFPTLILLVFLRRFLRTYVDLGVADALVLTYAFGTLAFSYSLLFMSHQPSSVLLFTSFFGLWRWSRSEWTLSRLPICGGLAAASVVAEYTAALGVICIVFYGSLVLIQRRASMGAALRAASLFVLGGLPFLAFLMWYHQKVFGSPLETGYRHLADAGYIPWHQGGFLGIGLPNPRALALSFFSPLRGLFVLSPALLLVGPGLLLMFRRARMDLELKPIAWATVLLVFAYTYFTASFSYESWGWTTGPRHLTSLVPFLLLPCALALGAARETRFRGPCGALLAGSVILTSALTFINYIPDTVSNAIAELAVPLSSAGYLSPSLLCAFGITNPGAGIILWCGVGLVVGWLIWSFPPQASLHAWLLTVSTIALIAVPSLTSSQNSLQDQAALVLLKRVWLTPPGRSISLFPSNPRG